MLASAVFVAVAVDDVPFDPLVTALIAAVGEVERAAVVAVPRPVVAVTRPLVGLADRGVVVADAEVVGRVAVVGRTVPLGRVRVDVAVVVGPVVAVAVVVGPVPGRMSFTIDELHVTVAPPPLPDPMHWLIVTGNAAVEVDAVTVHLTRLTPPPPLPD